MNVKIMKLKYILINDLKINNSNDRHGELENESFAIAWLFSEHETHMNNLAKDIAQQGMVYEPPLVFYDGDHFTVFDGNRRVTCLKLMDKPHIAPTSKLQKKFANIRKDWNGEFLDKIQCQVENDRDRLDNILYRRHTGTQGGVGQSNWNDRMKANFVSRTGKSNSFNVADEIEILLSKANLLPTKINIPRSTINRLLSAEQFRNRLGFGIKKKKFEFTHKKNIVLAALARVANDLATQKIVLKDIWDIDGKHSYLDRLEEEGVLPTSQNKLINIPLNSNKNKERLKPTVDIRPTIRKTLIPQKTFRLSWPGRLQRHHQIWEELQFQLQLSVQPNAISVLFRVLLELSVLNYIEQQNIQVHANDKFANRVLKVGHDLFDKKKINNKQLGIIKKFQNTDQIISADTLNRYVHSSNFAPSPDHLTSIWDSMADFIVECLEA